MNHSFFLSNNQNDGGRLFCKCGQQTIFTFPKQTIFTFQEDPIFTFEEEPEDLEEPVNDIKCSVCENAEYTEVNSNEVIRKFVYANIYHNDDKISLSANSNNYLLEEKYEGEVKLIRFEQPFRITFNSKTGNMFLLLKRKIINISFLSLQGWVVRLLKDFITNNKDVFHQFLKECLKARGVKYKRFSSFQLTNEKIELLTKYRQVFLYLKYPQLQNIDLKNTFIGKIPKKMRRKLKLATKEKDLFYVLFNTRSKAVKSKMKNVRDFHFLATLSQSVKQPSNLLRLLELQQIKRNRKTADYLRFHVPNKEIFDLYTMKKNVDMFDFFIKHLTENGFVNKVIKEVKRPFYRNSLSTAIYIFHDVYDTYHKIIEIKPDYQINWSKSFEDIHNILWRDYERFEHENIIINYSEEERKLENTIHHHHFKLATDTLTLLDIGNEMDICVGTYRDDAISKHCLIVSVHNQHNKLVGCIEIKNNQIIQAVTNYNQSPKADLRKAIIAWANENKLTYYKF